MKNIIFSALVFVFFTSFLSAEEGVTESEILVGTSLPLEGPFAAVGEATLHGVQAKFNAVNDAGGVHGRKLKLIYYNDGYEPIPCVKNTKKLIGADKVFCLTSYVGTPTSVKVQPLWKKAKVPVIGFYTGAGKLRKPFSRYNIHVRGSYATEASSIIELFAKKKGHKKIAIFYQNDAFGEAVKSVTETAMNDHGLKPVALGSFERNTLEIETGLKNIVDAKPESIVMVGTYAPLAKFVKSAKAAGLKDSLFYTVSFVGPEVLSKELGDQGSNVFITQVIPPYQESSLPLVTKYKEDLAKYFTGEAPSFPGLEAYANACVLVEGLQNAGKDLTRENLIDSILAIDSGIASLGLNVSYGAEDNQGLENVFITSLQGEKWVEVK